MQEINVDKKVVMSSVLGFGAVILAVIFFFSSFFIVSPGTVAVKTRLGQIVNSYGEGFHFKIPLIENVIKFSIQIQRADIKTQSFSKDLQTMDVRLVVNHRIQQGTVVSIYRNMGPYYVNTVVDPVVQEVFKSISAKYSAEKIIGERNALVEEVNAEVKTRLMKNEIIVTDLSVVDLDFTDQFLKAVEDKQIAEQQAKMSEKLVEKAKRDAEQVIAKARAEAESLKMQRDAVTAQLIELRKVEAQIKAIEKWNGVLPTYVGGSTPFISLDRK
ncbi:MAG: HflC protein [Elusimicrobia bacterium CG08_land_8_20_14_0_20_51_18]|nr:MAG: HflC protein [Elusimicrobia bacterium CG08_land_8_20_14_0_20_51_18]